MPAASRFMLYKQQPSHAAWPPYVQFVSNGSCPVISVKLSIDFTSQRTPLRPVGNFSEGRAKDLRLPMGVVCRANRPPKKMASFQRPFYFIFLVVLSIHSWIPTAATLLTAEADEHILQPRACIHCNSAPRSWVPDLASVHPYRTP